MKAKKYDCKYCSDKGFDSKQHYAAHVRNRCAGKKATRTTAVTIELDGTENVRPMMTITSGGVTIRGFEYSGGFFVVGLNEVEWFPSIQSAMKAEQEFQADNQGGNGISTNIQFGGSLEQASRIGN